MLRFAQQSPVLAAYAVLGVVGELMVLILR